MKKITSRLAAICVTISLAAASFVGCGSSGVMQLNNTDKIKTEEYDSSASMDQVSSAALDFSLGFMNKAVENSEEENAVLSPVSAYLALTLLACGSSGKTAEELSATLRIPEDKWADYGNAIINWINESRGETSVKTANSIWFDSKKEYEPVQSYLDTITDALAAKAYEADLTKDKTVDAINKWVSDSTKGLIEKLRDKPYDEYVAAVILNALYFEAEWKIKFEAEDTTQKQFTTADGTKENVDFMNKFGCDQIYVKGNGYDGVVLPYSNDGSEAGDLAFVALRPEEGKSPKELLSSLTAEDLKAAATEKNTVFMNLSMPKFDVDYKQELNKTLAEIGLEQTINDGADMSGMFDANAAKNMLIDVMQVVKIQVDEEGTKAAAVTEIQVSETAAQVEQEEPMEFNLDRPFLYAIVDTDSGMPLFMGTMDNPKTE